MEYVSKEEFVDWVNHPTTRKIQKVLEEKVEQERANLSRRIHLGDDRKLQYAAGFVAGFEETIQFKNLFQYEDDENAN